MIATALICAASAAQEPADWRPCYDAVDWHLAAEVPDSELELLELAGTGGFEAYSRRWIRAALAAAPPLETVWAAAREQGRLVFWYVPAVEGQHVILPHLLDRYVQTGPLSDPDLVAFLNRRCLSLKPPAGGELAERWELVAPGFVEPGFLVFAPSGELLHRADRFYTFDSGLLLETLRALAAEHPEGLRPSASLAAARAALATDPGDDALALELAREGLLEGEYTLARELLAPRAEASPEAAYLLATLERRERRGEQALALLLGARERTKDSALRAAIDAERGLVYLRQGRVAAAEPLLEAARKARRSERAAEAGYYLGAVQYLTRRDGEVSTWKRTHAAHPESLWGAKAAACAAVGTDGAQGESPLTRAMQDLRWLPAEAYRPAPDTQWRRGPEDAPAIARRALEFLLTQQRADGSWRGPRWGGGPEDAESAQVPRGDNLEMAISAVCCAALHRWRALAPDEVDAALARGEAYLLGDDVVQRGEAVAWVYADAFRLLHFADRLESAERKHRRELERAMDGWIAHLVAQQEESGGPFRHYVYTSSFVTAAVTACLHRARAAGRAVPDEVFERSAATLERTRGGEQGLFGYLVERPATTRSLAGAASRQPLCVPSAASGHKRWPDTRKDVNQ